jgi:hypothetical protein
VINNQSISCRTFLAFGHWQGELLPSLVVCRPLAFHILIFSSETPQPYELKQKEIPAYFFLFQTTYFSMSLLKKNYIRTTCKYLNTFMSISEQLQAIFHSKNSSKHFLITNNHQYPD